MRSSRSLGRRCGGSEYIPGVGSSLGCFVRSTCSTHIQGLMMQVLYPDLRPSLPSTNIMDHSLLPSQICYTQPSIGNQQARRRVGVCPNRKAIALEQNRRENSAPFPDRLVEARWNVSKATYCTNPSCPPSSPAVNLFPTRPATV